MKNKMEWFKTAKPGDKLVCLNDKGWFVEGDRSRPINGPKLNEIVTIESTTIITKNNRQVVFLKEYKKWYNAIPFKPVSPLSTEKGMEIFHSILNGKLRVEDKDLEGA